MIWFLSASSLSFASICRLLIAIPHSSFQLLFIICFFLWRKTRTFSLTFIFTCFLFFSVFPAMTPRLSFYFSHYTSFYFKRSYQLSSPHNTSLSKSFPHNYQITAPRVRFWLVLWIQRLIFPLLFWLSSLTFSEPYLLKVRKTLGIPNLSRKSLPFFLKSWCFFIYFCVYFISNIVFFIRGERWQNEKDRNMRYKHDVAPHTYFFIFWYRRELNNWAGWGRMRRKCERKWKYEWK